jgi:selenocysteine-specific elongation factor
VDLVRREIEELTAGSFLEGAPVAPVSSTTGAGLADLRRELNAWRGRSREENAGAAFACPQTACFFREGIRHGRHRPL